MRTRRAFIFVSSPGAVTPYHIDHEYNFLLQIAGRKQMALHDRSAVSEQELERFYRGEHRNLALADRAGHRAQVFELGPGDGVHVPVNAPHYVRNGDAVSVSFSITFRTPEGDRRSAVYAVNDRLRRLGLAPRAVGAVPLVDRTKYLGYSIYQRAQRRLGRS
jgi:ribosomal protein L16 Arg81 hydroxylase